MGKHANEYKEKREKTLRRIANNRAMLVEFTRLLKSAEEKIPYYKEKIVEYTRWLDYHQREYAREFGGERDAKKERIARLHDNIEKLESELKLLNKHKRK